MIDTVSKAATRTLRHLNDEECEVWSHEEITVWLQEGYDRLVRQTEAIFDMVMFDHIPLAGNHTRPCEAEYMTGEDFPVLSVFNFTREPERMYAAPSAEGPANHTSPAEADYVDTPTARTLGRLPEGYVSVDRVTHDWLRLDPEHARELRDSRTAYETMQSGVFAYSMEQDGIFRIRTVGVPVPEVATIEIDGRFGLVRGEDTTEVGDDVIVGTWGILRSSPLHFPGGGQWGLMRSVVVDDRNTRVEMFRLGQPLSEGPFEIPSRFVRYVEFWAMHKAYTDGGLNGAGADKLLSKHYLDRFNMGVQRLLRRVRTVMDERTYHMGGKRGGKERDDYLSHFPTDYGYARPYRR